MSTAIDHAALSGLQLPKRPTRALAEYASALVDGLGERLSAVCVYGSAARGEYHAPTSDLDVLVVLADAADGVVDFAALEPIQRVVARGLQRERIDPMFVTRGELEASADVFCIKFDDLKRHHLVLSGRDPLRELRIDPAHLRFVCEFELRNVALRMRRIYLGAGGANPSGDGLARLLHFFASSLFPLRAVCTLCGREPSARTERAITTIGECVGEDPAVLETLWSLHRTGTGPGRDALPELWSAFGRFVGRAVERVDRIEESKPRDRVLRGEGDEA